VSTEIVKTEPVHRGGALSLAHMTAQEAWRFSEALAGASLLPQEYRNNPGSVLWALEYGRALGLDVVTTITTIHVIKGKPTQSADLMLSRAREAGHRVRIKSERERCVVTIVRRDDPEDENVVEWTLADARTANLFPGKPDSNWAKYPRAMLRARAIAECVRIACPEVLHGAIYTAEELGARVDDAGLPVEAEVQQLRRVEPGEADPWTTPAPEQQSAEAPAVEPHKPAQEIADQAEEATTKERIAELWGLAKTGRLMEAPVRAADTGKIAELGQYLTRRAKALAEQQANGSGGQDEGVVDAEVVTEPEDDHAAAVAELREAAAAARLEDFENGAQMALGMPIEQASADAIRALAAQIRPAA
jgi:hypothetical protein